MDTKKIISEIIPADNRQHRDGFSNTHIIDKLDYQEKEIVEDVLISMLSDKIDMLVVETLAYLNSQKSLPCLYALLDKNLEEPEKIIIAVSIFQINKDYQMLDIAINSFKNIENMKDAYFVYRASSMFGYLRKFKNKATDSIINNYTNHSDYLLSYNAKQALGM